MQVLTWANNNAATGSWVGTEAPINYNRIAREWRFSENNGDIGDVIISIPTSGISAGTNVLLMVDDDGDFSS